MLSCLSINREALGQEVGGAWPWQEVRHCQAMSVEVDENPHRAGHCKSETRGSELEHKRYLIQPFSFSFQRCTLSGKLGASSKSAGKPRKRKTNIYFSADGLHHLKVSEERALLKGITDTENNDEIKPCKHISCKLIVLEAKGKAILEIAFGSSYSRCKCIEYLF